MGFLTSFISLYYLTIFSYTFLILAIFYILFNTNFFFLNASQLLRSVIYNKFYFFSLVIILLSLAGVPPLFGFVVKFFQLVLFLNKINFVFIVFFIIYNIVMIYFYIINLKYLIDQKKFSYRYTYKIMFQKNERFHLMIILILLLNLFGIFFVGFFLDFFQFFGTCLFN